MSTISSNRIPSLDGLRAVAVLLVVLAHLVLQGYIPLSDQATRAVETGRLGVTLFFVLSGFLITTLLLKELESTGSIDLGRFCWRRAWRILPAYMTYVLVLGILNAVNVVPLYDNELWRMLTLTSNLGNTLDCHYSVHTWSTSTQEQFYLLWPLVILLLGRRKGLYASVAVMMVCSAIRGLMWTIAPELIRATPFSPYIIVDALATGAALACARPWLQQQTFYQRLLGSRLFLLIPLVMLLTTLLGHKERINSVLGCGVRYVGMTLCLDWAMTNYKGRVGRFLNSRPVVFLGAISFSVYLWQQLFISPHPAARAPYNLIALGLVAATSYYWIEQPGIAAGLRLAKRSAAKRDMVGSDQRVRQSANLISKEQNRSANAL